MIELRPGDAPGEVLTVSLLSSDALVPSCPFVWERHEFCGWAIGTDEDACVVREGEPLSACDTTLTALWHKTAPQELPEGLDFSNARLIVGSEAEPDFGEVLSAYEGVWLLGFEDDKDAAWAYVEHANEVDFIAPDITVAAADVDVGEESPPAFEGTAANVVADLSAVDVVPQMTPGFVALIDTGVFGHEDNLVGRVSVLDGPGEDDNGHGTAMLEQMLEIDPQSRLLSIKALDDHGHGTAASVYAGIELAVQAGAKVVNLSLYAPATRGNAAVEQAIRDAYDAGVMVVGAAGNDGCDARCFVPGRMGKEVVVVGSSDENGSPRESSNYGDTVDVYVLSPSTSHGAARVSAWLCKNASFENALGALLSSQGCEALGARSPNGTTHQGEVPSPEPVPGKTDVANGQDSESMGTDLDDADGDESFVAAAGNSSLSMRAEWHGHAIGSDTWRVGGGQDAGGGDGYFLQLIQIKLNNNDGVDGGVSYATWCQSYGEKTGSNGSSSGTSGRKMAIEDVRVWLTGTIAKCYDVNYSALMCTGMEYVSMTGSDGQPIANTSFKPDKYSGWSGKTLSGSNGAYTHVDNHPAFSYGAWNGGTYSIAANQRDGGSVGVRKITLSLSPKSYTHKVQVRYQNADGTWGGYSVKRTTTNAYASTVPAWSLAADNTYQAASMAAYTASCTDTTKSVDVCRRTATNTIRVRYQNADGSYGAYSNVSSGVDRVGQVRSWSREADTTYQAASASITGTKDAQTKDVTVYRQTHTLAIRTYDPSGAEMARDQDSPPVTFKLSTNGGGTWQTGLCCEPSDLTVRHGQTIMFGDVVARDGIRVDKVTVESGTGAPRQLSPSSDGTYAVTVDSNLAVRIRTTLSRYTVHFDVNAPDITGGMEDEVVEHGVAYLVPQPTFERALFEFVGWNERADGTGAWYEPGREVEDLDCNGTTPVTLYAQWEAKRLCVRVPVAIHYVAREDGTIVGPDDGVARVQNMGPTAIQIAQARVDLYEPANVSVGLSLECNVIASGESAGLEDLRGRMEHPSLEEQQIGCIHWAFQAVA